MKKEVRIIAWDDAAFSGIDKKVLLVGAVFRGSLCMDGLLSTYVKKDGLDATEKISQAINSSRHYDQLSYIMLNGITFAGFNMVDIQELESATGMPVIAILRNAPQMEKFMQAMKRLGDYEKRRRIARRAGEIRKYREIFYQAYGMEEKECEELLKITCTRSNVPEPLRVAHLIAGGLSRQMHKRSSDGYESRGRA